MDKKFTKSDWEWEFFNEFYKFVQEFYIVEKNKTYWRNLVDRSRELYDKYNDPLAVQVVMGFIASREETYNKINEQTT